MDTQDDAKPLLVIGIGASAGGLDALKRFFKVMPHDSRFAFIVVQHLDPNHKSMMAEILNRECELTFYQAEDKQKLQANCGYVIPPDAYIEVANDTISIVKPTELRRGSRLAIDHLFRSMAESYQSKAVGLLFTGSGSDGTAGLRALKASGGLVIVQNPESAEYPSMPKSAIDAGVADQIVPVETIPDLLIRYAHHPYHGYDSEVTRPVTSEALRTITALLKAQENVDLNQYKEATVERRLQRRMSLLPSADTSDYTNLLRHNSAERQSLIRDLLISVTDFFRDKEAFELLEKEVLATLVDQAEAGTDIRVWVAGCASGEEAYTIAILLFEHIRQTEKELGVKVFATDVDENAIRIARRGVYPASIIFELPEKYRKAYFSMSDETHFVVNSKVRSAISFAIQNVYTDPPFSKVHLVSCRNVLIYLRRDVQNKVLRSFYFALRKNGFLFLGNSENAGEHKDLFKNVSKKWRIYQRQENHNVLVQPADLPSFSRKDPARDYRQGRKKSDSTSDRIKSALLSGMHPSVIIDGNDRALFFHGKLDKFVHLPDGQAELNFIAMLDSRLRTRIRSGIFKARKNAQRVVVRPPTDFVENNDTVPLFQTIISPVLEKGFDDFALVISFEELVSDPSSAPIKKESTDTVDQEKMIGAMEMELSETREELQNTVEELETSTEELKASHEESLATNEELQSSNEELEASTEELRSLNEELTTVNTQLKEKMDELSSSHDDIKNFFASTNLATVFLSLDMELKRFTPAAERLLRIGLPDLNRRVSDIPRALLDDETIEEARSVLNNLAPAEQEIETENGSWFVRKILPYRTEDQRIAGVVITYNEVTSLKTAVNNLLASGRQQAVIARLGINALRVGSVNNLMDQMVRELAFALDADYCKILEYRPEHHHLLIKSAAGWNPDLIGSAIFPDDLSSQSGFTLRSREPVIVEDFSNEKRFSGPYLLSDQKLTSGLSCIIEGDRNPWGVLAVHSRARRHFSKDDANFLVSAANILTVAIHREMTERQLKENENRLRIAKDSSQLGAFEFSLATGETYWDDRIKEIWGLNTGDEVTQTDFYQGLHPEDRDKIKTEVEALSQSDSDDQYRTTFRVISRKNEELKWVEASGQVLSEVGQPSKMIGMVTDITEKKKTEIALHTSVEQQKNANERKNEFLAILGHELRNPLAALSGGLQVMDQDPSKSDWALTMMRNNIRLVSMLLDDLLDLTRISRGEIRLNVKPVDIKALLQEVTDNFSSKVIKKNQQLTLHLPEEKVITAADRVRLEQVVTNLINNANRFTPNGGQITVVLTPPAAGKFEFSVQDTGIGIDIKDREKIFEPFQQLKAPGSENITGLGVGLSLVKQFVLLHNGGVDVASKGLGKGTKVTVTLPHVVNTEEVAEDEPALLEVDKSVDSLLGLRVLIVDDNEDAAQGLSFMLEMKGCIVETRYSGSSGLDCCSEFKPHVVILDIGLPDMDGRELLERIKARYNQRIFAMALTGFGHNEAQVNSKEAGFDVHINKPADLPLLLRTLSIHRESVEDLDLMQKND